MKMSTEKPSAALILEFQSDTPIRRECVAGLRAAIFAAQRMNPGAIALLAVAKYPEMTLGDAVKTYAAEIDSLAEQIDTLSSTFKNAIDTEAERLKPIASRASREMFSTLGQIETIKAQIKSAETHFDERTTRLEKSGLSEGEIALIHDQGAHDDAIGIMQTKLAAIESRHVALAAFCHSKDLSDLPAGFLEEVGHE